MREILALAAAGAAGTVGRWALSGWVYRLAGERFPHGTLAVNVLGCLILGFLMEVVVLTDLLPLGWRTPLTVGFLGAFTTFSTFGYETMKLVEDGAWSSALGNIALNLLLGLGAVWVGFIAARTAFGGT